MQLEAAKRYQYDAKNNYPVICSYRDFGSVYSFYSFPTREETKAGGNVPVGTLFDDGGHPINDFTIRGGSRPAFQNGSHP